MKYPVVISGIVFAGFVLSGCVGGTTYGTGVTHERQTLEGIANMFSLSAANKREQIDYAARPDLVVPADKNALPPPVEVESSTSDPNWPETPAERIARIRGDAVKPDERSGEIPLEELLRKKEGIDIDGRKVATGAELDRDGHSLIEEMQSNKDEKVRKAREKLAYAKGPQRKYLTEPPEEYRIPAATAVAGDQGIDKKIIDENKKKEEERLTDLTRGRN